MTPEIEEIKATIRGLRTDLAAAERALTNAYGPRIEPFARLLCSCFDTGELRRFVRNTLGQAGVNTLPEQCSLVGLAQASAVAFADAEVSRDMLRSVLLCERPRRATDIEASLKDWGAQ